jgi:hypothetical protein
MFSRKPTAVVAPSERKNGLFIGRNSAIIDANQFIGKPMPAKSAARSNLSRLVPHGYLVTRGWLLEQGVSPHSLDNLLKSGDLIAPVSGVYRRPDAALTWQGVVASIQRMGDRLVAGGVTALEEQGFAHYLPLGKARDVRLYGFDAAPRWVNRLGLPEMISHLGLVRLFELSVEGGGFTVEQAGPTGLPFHVSCPERAILEALADIPGTLSFDHADELMQGLVNLSPRRLDALLRITRSVKVKRLFFWLATRHAHAWLKKLDPSAYDFGHGKRLLARGGVLDSTWLITVPRALHG